MSKCASRKTGGHQNGTILQTQEGSYEAETARRFFLRFCLLLLSQHLPTPQYDDICENDNGYFIGSIICIDNSSDAFQTKELEVVDGQQRLTTLCLLLTAIYNRLKIHG